MIFCILYFMELVFEESVDIFLFEYEDELVEFRIFAEFEYVVEER